MAEISIRGTGQKLVCADGDNLMNILLKAGIYVDNPCNGKGKCGKCRVRIHRGSESEEVLSCLTEVREALEIELLQTEREHKVLMSGYLPEFERDVSDGGYGIAVDIGTTTVALSLTDLAAGEELAAASMINAQKHFGLDVLTRITYEYEHPETGVRELQEILVDSLDEMIRKVCRQAGISPEEVREVVVAANCTMTHMLLGVDARSLGKAPYRPQFTKAQRVKAETVGIRAAKNAWLYCLPQVSAYIGGDIVAGAHVCGLEGRTGNVLFIDIGTNGEIVLATDGRLLSCSCAAGPALEGMNISSGMRAAEGAIENIQITEEGLWLTVIGGGEPEGLCGSGILAVVRELLRTGILRKTGAFIRKEKLKEEDYRQPLLRMNGTKREFVIKEHPEIIVTQSDVRQVQLAKGAILSGVTALLRKAGVRMEDLDEILIAGQFGAHLPARLLTGTGILPAEAEQKITYVGNTSRTGAYMALLSKKARRQMEELADRMEYMELAETENYERIFAECMIFPENVR